MDVNLRVNTDHWVSLLHRLQSSKPPQFLPVLTLSPQTTQFTTVRPSLTHPHSLTLSSLPNAHSSCVLDLTHSKTPQRKHLTAVLLMSASLYMFTFLLVPNYSPSHAPTHSYIGTYASLWGGRAHVIYFTPFNSAVIQ